MDGVLCSELYLSPASSEGERAFESLKVHIDLLEGMAPLNNSVCVFPRKLESHIGLRGIA